MALLPEQGKVLDVAMGTGRNAVYLARRGYVVDGIDISQQAIEAALALAQKEGVPVNFMPAVWKGRLASPLTTYEMSLARMSIMSM